MRNLIDSRLADVYCKTWSMLEVQYDLLNLLERLTHLRNPYY
jgi:hypothetical protein